MWQTFALFALILLSGCRKTLFEYFGLLIIGSLNPALGQKIMANFNCISPSSLAFTFFPGGAYPDKLNDELQRNSEREKYTYINYIAIYSSYILGRLPQQCLNSAQQELCL